MNGLAPVEQIKKKVAIEELVGETVTLKRAGANYLGLCPFHDERTPSFVVSPGRGSYHCFGCQVGGDVFAFVMATQGVDFVEALRRLAPRAGVSLEPLATGTRGGEARGSRQQGKRVPSASGRQVLVRGASLEERGRRELAARARADQERAARLAGDLPPTAAAFLATLPALQEALRDPECPGSAYLRSRGLDPVLAADLGAGYSPPNKWPGDRGRKVGRVVYPLADPATGRVVSAMGRLCRDVDPAWPAEVQSTFRKAKQRKLAGCPGGVWPFQSISAARANGQALVLVEGPADALALLQGADPPLRVVGLCGTANVLTAAALQDLAGVVVALDDDAGGSEGARALRVDLAIEAVRVEMMPAGWLGACGAGDPADLANGEATGKAPSSCYASATVLVQAACARIEGPQWDTEAATVLLTEMYRDCAAAYATLPPLWSRPAPEIEAALDAACERRDLAGLKKAISAYKQACEELSR